MRYLIKYNRGWSDGCSITPFLPRFLRVRFNKWIVEKNVENLQIALEICADHDEAYYYGGSEDDRMGADATWLVDMLTRAKANVWFARMGYKAIRTFGGPRWRRNGVSWAYGGGYFQYSEKPAKPITETK